MGFYLLGVPPKHIPVANKGGVELLDGNHTKMAPTILCHGCMQWSEITARMRTTMYATSCSDMALEALPRALDGVTDVHAVRVLDTIDGIYDTCVVDGMGDFAATQVQVLALYASNALKASITMVVVVVSGVFCLPSLPNLV